MLDSQYKTSWSTFFARWTLEAAAAACSTDVTVYRIIYNFYRRSVHRQKAAPYPMLWLLTILTHVSSGYGGMISALLLIEYHEAELWQMPYRHYSQTIINGHITDQPRVLHGTFKQVCQYVKSSSSKNSWSASPCFPYINKNFIRSQHTQYQMDLQMCSKLRSKLLKSDQVCLR